jgi:hypothetical protein
VFDSEELAAKEQKEHKKKEREISHGGLQRTAKKAGRFLDRINKIYRIRDKGRRN